MTELKATFEKLESTATALKSTQEGTARELVQQQTALREASSALEKQKEKVAHFRKEAEEAAAAVSDLCCMGGRSHACMGALGGCAWAHGHAWSTACRGQPSFLPSRLCSLLSPTFSACFVCMHARVQVETLKAQLKAAIDSEAQLKAAAAESEEKLKAAAESEAKLKAAAGESEAKLKAAAESESKLKSQLQSAAESEAKLKAAAESESKLKAAAADSEAKLKAAAESEAKLKARVAELEGQAAAAVKQLQDLQAAAAAAKAAAAAAKPAGAAAAAPADAAPAAPVVMDASLYDEVREGGVG